MITTDAGSYPIHKDGVYTILRRTKPQGSDCVMDTFGMLHRLSISAAFT